MNEIRLGTVGSGMIVRSILALIQKTPGISLRAVYSRNAATGAALAKAFGGGRVYTELDAMLADPDVNTVYIASPNLLHYPQAKAALSAGKHVIVEKPFVTKQSQGKELAALAKSRGLLLVEAAVTPFLPNFTLLKKALAQIGEVRLVLSNYSQYSARYDRLKAGELPNIFSPAFGGGCLMDLNFYNVYLNVALFGRPTDAVYTPVVFPGAADTRGVLVLRYDTFLSSNAAAKDADGVNFFQIEGEDGTVVVENGANGLRQLHLMTKTEDRVLNDQPEPDRWLYEVRAVRDLFLREDRAALDALMKTTLDTVAVMENARKQAGLRFPKDD